MESLKRIRNENVAALARWGFDDWQIDTLLTMARRIHRLDEVACERELTDREEHRHEMALAQVTAIVHERNGHNVPERDLGAKHQGDPRGWPIVLTDAHDGGRQVRICPW